jgi:serine protease
VKVHDGAAVRASRGAGEGAAALTFDAEQADAERMQRQGLTADQARKDTAALNAIFGEAAVSQWGPLFDRDPLFLQDDREQAEQLSGSEHGDLQNYFLAVLGDAEKAEQLVDRANALPSVEIAYFAPIPEDADIPPETPNFETKQRYLDPAPEGIDARFAWTQRGGRGDGWRVIDIEQGWNFDHEDFPGRFFPDLRYKRHRLTAGTNTTTCGSRQHGTAVLGEIVALNDDRGVTGIAANAGWGTVSPMRDYSGEKKLATPVYRISEAINIAASMLTPGDAILIEQHMRGPNVNTTTNVMTDSGQACTCNCGQFGFIPMEYEKDTFDAIKNATARGVYVIEAAGNGDMDLAHTRYRLKTAGKSRFDRSVRDSGAILVGASQGASRDPECFTDHGAMVDVHSWGRNVVSTGYGLNQCTSAPIANSGWEVNGTGDDKQWYTARFSGTSSASPIVTGAVLTISGVRRAAGKPALTPSEMRALLKANGTPQGTGGTHGTKLIGPQPDLKRTIPKAVAAVGSGDSAQSLAQARIAPR